MRDTIFVVAPGPSLADVDVDLLRAQRVIAVKRAVFKVPFAEAVVSCHAKGFYDRADVRGLLALQPRLRPVFLKSHFEASWPSYLEAWEAGPFNGLSRTPRHLSSGGNSGHAAVNLAWHEGARRIVLVGFDMRIVTGPEGQKSHYDREGVHALDDFYVSYFVPAFRHIAADLAKDGVEVLNATPDSRLEVFPRADLRALVQPLDQE